MLVVVNVLVFGLGPERHSARVCPGMAKRPWTAARNAGDHHRFS
ncbi:hypothetical protein ACVGVP_07640 [Pseudonocardia artemisiae]